MENQTQLVIFIIITFIAIISPAMVVVALISSHRRRILEKEARIQQIEHTKQIESYKMAAEAEEREREKMAKNLHDSIIPTLSVIKSSLDMNAVDYDNNKYNLKRLKKDISILEQAIIEIRGISHDLVPPSLTLNGVIKALEEHIKYADETTESQIFFQDRTTFGDIIPFQMPEQYNIYRICLELLQNLKKYAGYGILHVVLENDNSNFKIEFIHDGKGISNEEIEDLTKSSKGLGLKSLKSRALILKADMDYSYDSQTAGIVIKIPFKR